MQIASSCKTLSCDKCSNVTKENEPPAEKCHQQQQNRGSSGVIRHRNQGRSRSQVKSRGHYHHRLNSQHSEQHRLDHTYAAAAAGLDEPCNLVIVDDEDEDVVETARSLSATRWSRVKSNSGRSGEQDDIDIKSTWLRNLCLEYQPTGDAGIDERPCFTLSGCNGTLKQYQRNCKVNKSKTELSSLLSKSKIVKSVQEDKKRWIAALALIELAQSK